MAISDLLTKLTDDIRDSYDAVEEKGGTLPEHKNTDSLPEAIRSIAGGGSVTGYGKIEFFKKKIDVFDLSCNYCTAEIVDNDLFGEWYAKTRSSSIDYYNGVWTYWNHEGEQIEIDDFSSMGLEVNLDSPDTDWANIEIYYEVKPDLESGIDSVDIDSAGYEVLHNLYDYYDTPAPFGDKEVYTCCIYRYYFGPLVEDAGDNFLAGNLYEGWEIDCRAGTNVTRFGNDCRLGRGVLSLPNLTSVGNGFQTASDKIELPKLETIGNYCTIYGGGELTLLELTSIGNNFTADSVENIRFPKVVSIGNNFSAKRAVRIDLDEVQTVGTYFLRGAQGVRLREGSATLYLYIPKIVRIGSYGLFHCNYSCFECIFPATIQSIGSNFLFESNGLWGDSQSAGSQIAFNCPPSVMVDSSRCLLSSATASEAVLLKKPLYGCGVGIGGTYKNEWVAALPTTVVPTGHGTAVFGRKTYVA